MCVEVLLSANYGDGLANAAQSWSYDAAGNRASDSSQPGAWSYDSLNRILSSPQGTYTHDVLGNRLSGPGTYDGYDWDPLGRMTSLTKLGGLEASYAYRADGMRVRKATHAGAPATRVETYRYDGQMPVEMVESTEDVANPTVDVVERRTLGARGTEMIERVTSSGTQARFPLYDAHGNSVATLGRSGSSWTLGDERSYDAWGRVRQGAQAGVPSSRYCASLGHVQDDESGLVYMRARYYEPGTGRFVSQDIARDGWNWFTYCSNDPLNMADQDGNEANSYAELLNLADNMINKLGQLLMGGFEVSLKGMIEQMTDKIIEGINKFAESNRMENVGWATNILKLLSQCIDIAKEAEWGERLHEADWI